MKTFRLDITSIGSPVANTGNYVDVTDYTYYKGTGLRKNRIQDQIYSRVSFTGNIKFERDVYSALRTLYVSGIYFVDIRISESILELQGELSLGDLFNKDESISENSIKTIDEFTTILDVVDNDIDILQVSPAVNNLVEKKGMEEITCDYYPGQDYWQLEQEGLDCSTQLSDIPSIALAQFVALNFLAACIINNQGWRRYYIKIERINCWQEADDPFDYFSKLNIHVTWHREILYTLDLAGEKNIPSGWIDINESYVFGGLNYHKFAKYPYVGFAKSFIWTDATNDIFEGNLDLSGPPPYNETVQYTRNRKLIDVLKYVIGKLDSTILFEDNTTALTTDSFYYLKTFTKNSEHPFKYILIAALKDTLLSDGAEPTNPAVKCFATFTQIMEWFNSKDIFWIIEKRDDDYYFLLKHLSEVDFEPSTLPAHDLQNFHNENWSANRNTSKLITSKKYSRIRRSTIANGIDFVGVDRLIPKCNVFSLVKDVQLHKFYSDIWDMHSFPENYPPDSTSHFAIFATNKTEGDNLITNFSNSASPFEYDDVTWNNTAKQLDLEFVATGEPGHVTALSNSISGLQNGSRLKISFGNFHLSSGTKPVLTIIDAISTPYTYGGGYNEFFHNYSAAPSGLLIIAITTQKTDSTDARFTGFSLVQTQYETRIKKGELSGDEILNVDLSIANADHDSHYDTPADEAIINNETVAITLAEQQYGERGTEIICPIYRLEEMDFTKIIKTDQGNAIAESLEISIDGEFAKFIPLFK